MTAEAAQTWLSTHQQPLPALEIHHRQALAILENHASTVSDLADVIALDPGMSVSVYREVNGRLSRRGDRRVESVHTALGLLGDGAIADLVTSHPVLERAVADPGLRQSYHQLTSRGYHLQAQLQHFLSLQGIRSVREVLSAGLLHNIGEYCACLFDHDHYRRYEAKFRQVGIDCNSAKAAFGFDFHALGKMYAKQHFLPQLVIESLDEKIPPGRKARLIQLAADLSHQAETGWHHPAMRAVEEVCAAYLNQSPEGLEKRLQQIALDAARACPFADVLPAAARLIMLPDDAVSTPAAVPRAPSPGAGDNPFEQRIRSLLETNGATQARLLDLLMTHLHNELHLSRVVLLLVSRDRKHLGTRAGKGIDEHSPVRRLVVDLERESLLKSLLAKPQSIWVEPSTYPRFEAALPKRFREAFLHENFFLMSLFVGTRPVGLIFADRAPGVPPVDKALYLRFKSAILLTAKALSRLARRRRGTLA